MWKRLKSYTKDRLTEEAKDRATGEAGTYVPSVERVRSFQGYIQSLPERLMSEATRFVSDAGAELGSAQDTGNTERLLNRSDEPLKRTEETTWEEAKREAKQFLEEGGAKVWSVDGLFKQHQRAASFLRATAESWRYWVKEACALSAAVVFAGWLGLSMSGTDLKAFALEFFSPRPLIYLGNGPQLQNALNQYFRTATIQQRSKAFARIQQLADHVPPPVQISFPELVAEQPIQIRIETPLRSVEVTAPLARVVDTFPEPVRSHYVEEVFRATRSGSSSFTWDHTITISGTPFGNVSISGFPRR